MTFLHQFRVTRTTMAITSQIVATVYPDAGPVEWFRLLWRAGDSRRLYLARAKQSAEAGVVGFTLKGLQYKAWVKPFLKVGVYEVQLVDGDGEYSGNKLLVVALRSRKKGRAK